MDIKRAIGLGISALGLAGSVYLGAASGNTYSKAEAELQKHPCYAKAGELEKLASKLSSAESELRYSSAYTQKIGKTSIYHPARYPDAKDAKKLISETFNRLNEELKEGKRLCEILKGVYDSLPEQNGIKVYNWARVDNTTFEKQRIELTGIAEKISEIKNMHLGEVPQELLSKKDLGIGGLVGCILGGLFFAASGLYSFLISGIERKLGYP